MALLWDMERKQGTAVAILDLSAAFDTVDHKLLLEVVQKRFGICDMALLSNENYSRPFWKKVCINGKYSSSKSLAFSVPHGSCSRDNIFTAYFSQIIDVILKPVTNWHCHKWFCRWSFNLYKMFNPSLVDHDIQTIANLEGTLTNISSWMDTMCLKLNGNKTEYILNYLFIYKFKANENRIKDIVVDH